MSESAPLSEYSLDFRVVGRIRGSGHRLKMANFCSFIENNMQIKAEIVLQNRTNIRPKAPRPGASMSVPLTPIRGNPAGIDMSSFTPNGKTRWKAVF